MNQTSGLQRTKHEWSTDEAYIEAQAADSSWSHKSDWGKVAAKKFVSFGNILVQSCNLYHSDIIADFGGNDGTAANAFYLTHAIKPIVIDCEPLRLEFAATQYGLPVLECFIEKIPLPDDMVDWGFTSHTLEHTRDPEAAVREIARVVKRACLFILPIENADHSDVNEAHAFHSDNLKGWKDLIISNGWRIKKAGKKSDGSRLSCEAQIVAVPR